MNAECPNCHSPVVRLNRFCNQCGQDLRDIIAALESPRPAADNPRTVLLSELAASPTAAPVITQAALADAIIASGLVAREEIERAQRDGSKRLYQALIEAAPVREASLRDLMSRSFQLPIIDLHRAQTDAAVISRFPAPQMKQYQVWPVAETAEQWTLAVADPTDEAALRALEKAANKKIELRLATASELRERLQQHFSPKLVGVLSSGEKIEFALTEKETEIGKATHNKLVLNDATVSNTHAIILEQNSGYSIVDLGSRNGTFVNDQKLGNDAVILKHGDKVTLGRAVLTFRRTDETPQNATMRLDPAALAELSKRYAVNAATVTPAPQPAVAARWEKPKRKRKRTRPRNRKKRMTVSRLRSSIPRRESSLRFLA